MQHIIDDFLDDSSYTAGKYTSQYEQMFCGDVEKIAPKCK